MIPQDIPRRVLGSVLNNISHMFLTMLSLERFHQNCQAVHLPLYMYTTSYKYMHLEAAYPDTYILVYIYWCIFVSL